MRRILRSLGAALLAGSLASCVFTEPVFTEGLAKIDPGLNGVWVKEGENGDPRKTEFAVFVPVDEERSMLHHPSGEKGGIYYEARPVKIRDRRLLQLRVLATLNDGLPGPAVPRFTLVWLEPQAGTQILKVRALEGAAVKDLGPAGVKKILEDPAGNWSALFGEAMDFRRLKDN